MGIVVNLFMHGDVRCLQIYHLTSFPSTLLTSISQAHLSISHESTSRNDRRLSALHAYSLPQRRATRTLRREPYILSPASRAKSTARRDPRALREEIQELQIEFDVGMRTHRFNKRHREARKDNLRAAEDHFKLADDALSMLAEALVVGPVFKMSDEVAMVNGK